MVPTPFWHLKSLEVVPHPRGEMLSSMSSSNKQRNRKCEKTSKPKIRLVIYYGFSLFDQKSNMILWSIRTFWYKGSAENKKNNHARETKQYFSRTTTKNSKYDFSKKSRYDVNMLILSRYDIIFNI